jgi:hypothetical protein
MLLFIKDRIVAMGYFGGKAGIRILSSGIRMFQLTGRDGLTLR